VVTPTAVFSSEFWASNGFKVTTFAVGGEIALDTLATTAAPPRPPPPHLPAQLPLGPQTASPLPHCLHCHLTNEPNFIGDFCVLSGEVSLPLSQLRALQNGPWRAGEASRSLSVIFGSSSHNHSVDVDADAFQAPYNGGASSTAAQVATQHEPASLPSLPP
jgi:hypothetical protein